eukprot:1161897-Pelagomonas_calceolata.AAC.12
MTVDDRTRAWAAILVLVVYMAYWSFLSLQLTYLSLAESVIKTLRVICQRCRATFMFSAPRNLLTMDAAFTSGWRSKVPIARTHSIHGCGAGVSPAYQHCFDTPATPCCDNQSVVVTFSCALRVSELGVLRASHPGECCVLAVTCAASELPRLLMRANHLGCAAC